MKYYAIYNKTNEKLSKAQVKCLNDDCVNIEVSKEVYDNLNRYMYQDGLIVENPNYEQEQEQKEQERIAKLNMTRGDFLEGMIIAFDKDENDIITLIERDLPITDMEKKIYINRVRNALDFYRGYPVIDVLCGKLGISTDKMTEFFETKDYKVLLEV